MPRLALEGLVQACRHVSSDTAQDNKTIPNPKTDITQDAQQPATETEVAAEEEEYYDEEEWYGEEEEEEYYEEAQEDVGMEEAAPEEEALEDGTGLKELDAAAPPASVTDDVEAMHTSPDPEAAGQDTKDPGEESEPAPDQEADDNVEANEAFLEEDDEATATAKIDKPRTWQMNARERWWWAYRTVVQVMMGEIREFAPGSTILRDNQDIFTTNRHKRRQI